jgi:hypothetical protein
LTVDAICRAALGLDVILDDAMVMYGAALALHRARPS